VAAVSDATRVAIVGLGAVGGSVALKLIERDVRPRGFTTQPEDARAAADAGVLVADSIRDAVADADLVLIAVPIAVLRDVSREVVSSAPEAATILHAGSLQQRDVLGLDDAMTERVIGTHPIAGTHRSGFAGASADLFRGAEVSVERRAPAHVRDDAALFWSMAGAARIAYRDADDHDALMGRVSHVPQLLATALASVLADAGVSASSLGPGGRDMTRLAGSSLAMWEPILTRMPTTTAQTLDAVISRVAELRDAASSDPSELRRIWSTASSWRRELDR
jgi:prephenate dehydrogenase